MSGAVACRRVHGRVEGHGSVDVLARIPEGGRTRGMCGVGVCMGARAHRRVGVGLSVHVRVRVDAWGCKGMGVSAHWCTYLKESERRGRVWVDV